MTIYTSYTPQRQKILLEQLGGISDAQIKQIAGRIVDLVIEVLDVGSQTMQMGTPRVLKSSRAEVFRQYAHPIVAELINDSLFNKLNFAQSGAFVGICGLPELGLFSKITFKINSETRKKIKNPLNELLELRELEERYYQNHPRGELFFWLRGKLSEDNTLVWSLTGPQINQQIPV